jgi:hypothetical protein
MLSHGLRQVASWLIFDVRQKRRLAMNDFPLPHVLFWPWALAIGVPVIMGCWAIRARFEKQSFQRAMLSLVIACAIAPTAIYHGAGLFIVYAFPLLFTGDLSLGPVAALPPILLIAGFVFTVWSWRIKKKEG